MVGAIKCAVVIGIAVGIAGAESAPAQYVPGHRQPSFASYFDTIQASEIPDLARGRMRISVEGVLHDSKGNPIAGAVVALREEAPWRWSRTQRYNLEHQAPSLIDEVIARTKTNSKGHYEFNQVQVLEKPLGRSANCFWHVFAAVSDGRMGYAFVYTEKAAQQAEIRKTVDVTLRDAKLIEGQCLDAQGRPMRGIEVLLGSMQSLSPAEPGKEDVNRVQLLNSSIQPRVMTDQDGRFRFPSAPAGILCRVSARPAKSHLHSKLVGSPKEIEEAKANYSRADSSPTAQWVIPALAASPATIKAVDPVFLGGVVKGDDDTPLANIKVSLSLHSPYVMTDESGRFRIPGPKEWLESHAKTLGGKVSLSVGDFTRDDSHSSDQSAATYMSLMTNVSFADSLTESGVEIQMKRGGIVIGKVITAATGDPVAGVSVIAERQRNPSRKFSTTQADGGYRFVLPPSEYRLRFYGRLPGYELPIRQPSPRDLANDSRFTVEVNATAGATTDAPLMVIEQLDPIDVHVQDAAGKPIRGASVFGLYQQLPQANRPVGPLGLGQPATLGPRSRTDDNGDCSLELLSRSWMTATLYAQVVGGKKLTGQTRVRVEDQERIVITVK